MGYSGVWDEFGNKRAGAKFRLAAVAKRIRQIRGHKTMTYAQIANALLIDAEEIKSICIKHKIKVGE